MITGMAFLPFGHVKNEPVGELLLNTFYTSDTTVRSYLTQSQM
jgi:hypothetical protein